MRNLKRVLSLALATVMLLGMMVIGAGAADAKKEAIKASDLTDMATVVNKDAVNLMVDLNIVEGKPDKTYAPTETVDRATMAKLIYKVLMGSADESSFKGVSTPLTDIKDNWAEGFINYAYSMKIVAGVGEGKFNPSGKVTVASAAKMLLVALGYDPEASKYVGDAMWSVNIMRDAQVAGLLKGISQKSTEELTRDNAAQMIYNALNIKTVKPEFQIDQGIKYLTRYNSAKTTLGYQTYGLIKVTGEVARLDDAKAVFDNVLPEKGTAVCTLVNNAKLPGNADVVGKKVTLFVKGVLDEVGAVESVEKVVSTALAAGASNVLVTVTSGIADIEKAVTKADKDNFKCAMSATIKTILNGTVKDTAVAPTKAAVDNAVETAMARKGAIVEFISSTDDGVADTLKVTDKQVKILTGDAATKVDGDNTLVKVPGVLSSFISANTTKNVLGYEGLKKDDVVLYYVDGGGTHNFEKITPMVAQLTATKGAKLTIGGETYTVSGLAGAMSFDSVVAEGYNKDVNFWLDNGKNVIKAKAVKADTTTSSALMLGFQTISASWAKPTYQALLLFADGTTKLVDVANGDVLVAAPYEVKNFNSTTAATYAAARFANIQYVEYSVNKDDKYELTIKTDRIADITAVNTDIKANVASFGGNVANANTVFIAAQYKDGSSAKEITGYKTYTGIANIPTFKAADIYVYNKDNVAKLVFITEGAAQGGEKNYAYVKSVADKDIGFTPKTDTTDAYYSFDAVVDGVNTTLKVKTKDMFATKGLYQVTYTDSIVTSMTSKVADQTEKVLDNLGGGVIKIGSTNYTFVDDAMAYIVDGKDASAIAVADVVDDANDLVLIVQKNETTIKSLYIVKIADAAMPTTLGLTVAGGTNVDLLTADKTITVAKGTTALTVASTAAKDTNVTVKIDGAGIDATDGTYDVVSADKAGSVAVTVTIKNNSAPFGTLVLNFTVKFAQ